VKDCARDVIYGQFIGTPLQGFRAGLGGRCCFPSPIEKFVSIAPFHPVLPISRGGFRPGRVCGWTTQYFLDSLAELLFGTRDFLIAHRARPFIRL
jgi:hypothetical protein